MPVSGVENRDPALDLSLFRMSSMWGERFTVIAAGCPAATIYRPQKIAAIAAAIIIVGSLSMALIWAWNELYKNRWITETQAA
jgi:hypothetical protein